MSTRAKFKINSIAKRQGWNGHKYVYDLNATAVTGTSEENQNFFASTPSGELKLGVVAEGSLGGLDVGDEIYLIIEKAEKA